MGECRQFKFDTQIDLGGYLYMRDRSPLNQVCSGSRDLFRFW